MPESVAARPVPLTLAIPRETRSGERRVAATPENVTKLTKVGFKVFVEAGAGAAASFPDDDYAAAGAIVVKDTRTLWSSADMVLKVHPPEAHPKLQTHEAELLKSGAHLIGFIWPARSQELLTKLSARKATVLAMDCVPRISRAQSMDALSSQASCAGYQCGLIAAARCTKFFPMLTTAAGTIRPARVDRKSVV